MLMTPLNHRPERFISLIYLILVLNLTALNLSPLIFKMPRISINKRVPIGQFYL
jgi:hypothetical protein